MAKPSVDSRTLAVLRTIVDVKQAKVETRAGYQPGSMSNYERRKEPPPDALAELVGAGIGLPLYLIRRTMGAAPPFPRHQTQAREREPGHEVP